MVKEVVILLADIPALCQDVTACRMIASLCRQNTRNTPEFIAGRRLLAYCAGLDALKTLQYTSQGKPYFPDLSLPRFSLSHSKNKLVLAFTPHHEIGIDLEEIRPRRNITSLAEAYFNSEELAMLNSIKDDKLALDLFWLYWTRHESFIKQSSKTVWNMMPSDTIDASLDALNLSVHSWNIDKCAISLCCHKELCVSSPRYITL